MDMDDRTPCKLYSSIDIVAPRWPPRCTAALDAFLNLKAVRPYRINEESLKLLSKDLVPCRVELQETMMVNSRLTLSGISMKTTLNIPSTYALVKF